MAGGRRGRGRRGGWREEEDDWRVGPAGQREKGRGRRSWAARTRERRGGGRWAAGPKRWEGWVRLDCFFFFNSLLKNKTFTFLIQTFTHKFSQLFTNYFKDF
jgi:hypothetical protein